MQEEEEWIIQCTESGRGSTPSGFELLCPSFCYWRKLEDSSVTCSFYSCFTSTRRLSAMETVEEALTVCTHCVFARKHLIFRNPHSLSGFCDLIYHSALAHPISFIFMQFLANNLQNNRLVPPSPVGNPGSATTLFHSVDLQNFDAVYSTTQYPSTTTAKTHWSTSSRCLFTIIIYDPNKHMKLDKLAFFL